MRLFLYIQSFVNLTIKRVVLVLSFCLLILENGQTQQSHFSKFEIGISYSDLAFFRFGDKGESIDLLGKYAFDDAHRMRVVYKHFVKTPSSVASENYFGMGYERVVWFDDFFLLYASGTIVYSNTSYSNDDFPFRGVGMHLALGITYRISSVFSISTELGASGLLTWQTFDTFRREHTFYGGELRPDNAANLRCSLHF